MQDEGPKTSHVWKRISSAGGPLCFTLSEHRACNPSSNKLVEMFLLLSSKAWHLLTLSKISVLHLMTILSLCLKAGKLCWQGIYEVLTRK